MSPFKISRENGFTILEVVFAVSILAIGIMGYTILKTSSRHSRVYAKNLSQAIQVTSSELEGLVTGGYHDALLSDNTTPGATTHDYNAEVGGTLGRGDFQASNALWTVREACPSELTKLVNYQTIWFNKDVDVTQIQVRP